MLVSTLFTVLSAGLATAIPLDRRAVTKLDAAATAEAQKKDNTATRAFTATTITTSDGKCLTIDPLGGDFRENLIPITAAACNGSPNQNWDVITKGVHNNVPGQALIVSSVTNGCMNFDPRRAAGNQVLLFSCGGRADGGGQVTDSQLFAFTDGKSPQTLQPQNGKGKVCLTIKNGALDQADCNNDASEVFTFGGKGGNNNSGSGNQNAGGNGNQNAGGNGNQNAGGNGNNDANCANTVTKTVTVTVTAGGGAAATPATPATTNVAIVTPAAPPSKTTGNNGGKIAVSGAKGFLEPSAVAEAQARDDTATRELSGATIKDSKGLCLNVDVTLGDFRENLIPVLLKPCDGSDGQKFDFITQGKHNDGKDKKTLIVSSLTNGCLSFDDRKADNLKVHIFSCGGRADGSGQTADSQLFNANINNPYVLNPSNGKTTCFENNNGQLFASNCDPTKPSAEQQFTVGGAGAGNSGNSGNNNNNNNNNNGNGNANTTIAPPTKTTPPPSNNNNNNNNGTPIAVSGAKGTLEASAVAEAQAHDDTATRIRTGTTIKDSTGKCLSVDFTAGDFRENLIPVQVKDCDGSDSQKFDFITKGKHNNSNGKQTLIVSSATNGCLSFDDRKADNLKVHIFSCGGRADGSGQTADSQLFNANLSNPYVLNPSNGKTTCFQNNNGQLFASNCDPTKPSATQQFTVGN